MIFYFRFVRIQGKLQKAVSSLDFFTSKGWTFSNDNMYLLEKALTPEDRKVSEHFFHCLP
jgi:fatty acyl-CoA reductase